MDQRAEDVAIDEGSVPSPSVDEALSTGWRATNRAVCLGWPFLLLLAGGVGVLGLPNIKSGIAGGVYSIVCVAIFVISGCVSIVQVARIAVSLVCGKDVRNFRCAHPSRLSIQGAFEAVVWTITSTKDLIVVAAVGLLCFPRFGMAFRFAVCEVLAPRVALAKSWRVTNGRVQEILRVTGTVAVAIGACLVLLTGILAVVLGKNSLDPAEVTAVKWAHFLLSSMTIVSGLVWMNASVSALIGEAVSPNSPTPKGPRTGVE